MNWRPDDAPLIGAHADLLWIAPIFKMAMAAYGGGVDAFYRKERVLYVFYKDLRFSWVGDEPLSKEWFFALIQLAASIIKVANQMARMTCSETEYYLVVEPGHFRLEITLHSEAPNIKGWEKGKYLYVHAGVRKILEGV